MAPLVFRLLALALLLAPAPRASTALEADFFDDLARRAYAARDYPKALDAFLSVNEIAPSAGSLYNVAVTSELTGKPDVAYAFYREYLARDDADAERRRDAERRLAELRRALALVEVTSEPPGAAIYVERRELGAYGVTPRTLALGPGEHRLFFELDGHEPAEAVVSASLGATASTHIVLSPRMGELTVSTEPPGAQVALFRAGERVEARGEQGRYRLPVGSYVLRIHPRDYATAETRVLVSTEAPCYAALVAEPLPQATGKLLVSAGGVAAKLLIDGRPRAVTPAVLAGLAGGDHQLEVLATGFAPYRRQVRVRAGHATYVEVKLEPRPEHAP